MPPLSVFELRNYVMHPGKRDVLIDIFERNFIEAQEELGIRVAATFRNLDDPNRFVWIRGFESMETRARALDGFYSGPLWQSLRDEANATMIDSDDVLLLRPVSNIAWARNTHPQQGAAMPANTIVSVTYFLKPGADEAFARTFVDDIAPAMRDAGVEIVATLVTEHSPNSYPRLPVREGETVFVALLRLPAGQSETLDRSSKWGADQHPKLVTSVETLRLAPTARSALR